MPTDPETVHTDAELEAVAEIMPALPDTLETTADDASSWPREIIDPEALAGEQQGAAAVGDRQQRLQPPQVAGHERLHVGVGGGGGEALPFAHLRRHLGGERDGQLRPQFAHDGGGAPLVRRVDEGVQEADREAFHALGPHELDLPRHRFLVQRQQHWQQLYISNVLNCTDH